MIYAFERAEICWEVTIPHHNSRISIRETGRAYAPPPPHTQAYAGTRTPREKKWEGK